jgi:hypothetical protein
MNQALIRCYLEGILTSAEVMPTAPWFPESVQLLQDHPGLDVGIHLSITCEWDGLKWRPLTNCPSLITGLGYFYPMIYPHPYYPGQSVMESNWNLEDIAKEFRAQIEMTLRKIPQVSHISSHMGCAEMTDEVKELTQELAVEYNLIYPLPEIVQQVHYQGPSHSSGEKLVSFVKMLASLEPARTYLFIDHPGLDGDELRAISHIGYEGVAEDRQGVTDTLTSQVVKDLIQQKGIRLVNYQSWTE